MFGGEGEIRALRRPAASQQIAPRADKLTCALWVAPPRRPRCIIPRMRSVASSLEPWVTQQKRVRISPNNKKGHQIGVPFCWRRRRDSNSRTVLPVTRFPIVRPRPTRRLLQILLNCDCSKKQMDLVNQWSSDLDS